MNTFLTYGIIFVILLVLELAYFKIADKYNIIDKPNERSSHSTIVLRGGGIIFLLGAWVWAIASLLVPGFNEFQVTQGLGGIYPFFLIGLTLVAGISFVDDVHSLPDSVRLVVQFTAAGLAFYQLGLFDAFQVSGGSMVSGIVVPSLFILLALIVYVGATNIINFMDGINGITAGYALAVLVPLALLNGFSEVLVGSDASLVSGGAALLNASNISNSSSFVDQSLVIVSILSVLVFCIFNFRPKGKAKCFAGDVGSIGIAFIMLFLLGKVIIATGDFTYLIFLLIYGADGILTICHRIMLHENLGEAHRKHAYQLMCNELKIGHVKVSLLYMAMQLVVSLGFIYVCPNTVLAHWVYFLTCCVIFIVAYILFKKKYYHLHEEYLRSLKR